MTGPRSLVDMALKVAVDNASEITDLSNVSHEYASTILKSVKSATQLHELEVNTGDGTGNIYDLTAEHWKRFIQADFPQLSARHKLVPRDTKSWHKVYAKYQQLDKQALVEATEKMQERFAAHKQQHDSRRSTIVSAAQGGKMRRTRARAGWGVQREKQTAFDKVKNELKLQSTCFKILPKTDNSAAPAGQTINKDKTISLDSGDGELVSDKQEPLPATPITRVSYRRRRVVLDSSDIASSPTPRKSQPKRGRARILSASSDEELVVEEPKTPTPAPAGHADNKGHKRLFSDSSDEELVAVHKKPKPSTAAPPKPLPRKRGFLSAAPGANKIHHLRKIPAPTDSSAPPASRPSLKPAPLPLGSISRPLSRSMSPPVSIPPSLPTGTRSASPPFLTAYYSSGDWARDKSATGPRTTTLISSPRSARPLAPPPPPPEPVNSLSTGGTYRVVAHTLERPRSPGPERPLPENGRLLVRRRVHKVHFFTAANRLRLPD